MMQRTKIVLIICLLVSTGILSACSNPKAEQVMQAELTMVQALPNAEYPIDITSTGKAQLKGGVFEETAAPGSAAMARITLGGQQAVGDLNGDGLQDAAVTLIVDTGGRGTFTYLAAVINQNGTPQPVASIAIGDRIIIQSLDIQSEVIIITYLTRKPDDPMTAPPTVEVTQKFKLQSEKIVGQN